MKRFWKTVEMVAEDGGWGIALDGRTVRTPAKAPLVVPTRGLAEAIAGEWRDAPETADPRAMPLTGLANAAIDRVAPDPAAFASGLAAYGQADLACYRSESPPELVQRQAAAWDPLLAWARRRFDVDFVTTSGILHVPQPPTIERLTHAVAALDAFRLAGLAPLVTIGGSLIAGLALLENAISVEDTWRAVSVDERWQLERWGEDVDAKTALDLRERDFRAAVRFLELLE